MNEFALLLSVFALGVVAGVLAWHFGHARVAKELALAKAELDWLKSLPGTAVTDVEAVVKRIVEPISSALTRVESAVSSVPVKTAAVLVKAAPAPSEPPKA